MINKLLFIMLVGLTGLLFLKMLIDGEFTGNKGSYCVICKEEITKKDRNFALYPEYHPGILGPIHLECYEKAVEEIPDLPWTDPISGVVDYREMGESIGLSDPEEDMEFEDDFYEG